jgi:hypothetical protein
MPPLLNDGPRTRQRVHKPPPTLAIPDIEQDAAERKRVLNVLAQRRYRNPPLDWLKRQATNRLANQDSASGSLVLSLRNLARALRKLQMDPGTNCPFTPRLPGLWLTPRSLSRRIAPQPHSASLRWIRHRWTGWHPRWMVPCRLPSTLSMSATRSRASLRVCTPSSSISRAIRPTLMCRLSPAPPYQQTIICTVMAPHLTPTAHLPWMAQLP